MTRGWWACMMSMGISTRVMTPTSLRSASRSSSRWTWPIHITVWIGGCSTRLDQA
jgi:hypothetical protein